MANPFTEGSMGQIKFSKQHAFKNKDLSSLYALYWHFLFNRCMIIKHWAKYYVKLSKGGKISNSNHLHMVQ